MLASLLVHLLACSPPPAPEPAKEAPLAPATGGAEAPAPETEDRSHLAAAPTRSWYGLSLGESDEAALSGWLATHVPGCTGSPSPMRESVQYRCTAGLQPELLPDRTIRGELTTLLFVRPETGPLHHVSTVRRYSLPDRAVADFAGTVSALTAALGPPAEGARALERPDQLDARFGRWWVDWSFRDLQVRVSAVRVGQDYTSITEMWEVPGVVSTIASRPGAGGHGGRPSPNPHLAQVASPAAANVAPARVEEVLRADGRVFARVREAQWDFWVSLPEQALAAGDHVLLGRGPLRSDVRLEALGRSLAQVYELPGAEVVTEEAARARVQLAPVDGGLAIGDVFARREALAGNAVRVRGRVVKASKGIFGTNWYHLQDGSGDEKVGTHDLTVTSDGNAEVGDVVVAEGALTKDKDLGFGYFYPAIIENASVRPEPGAGK